MPGEEKRARGLLDYCVLHDRRFPLEQQKERSPMNIFVAGGGRVGFHLARLLSSENQDVTVIEADADQVELIDYSLDVSTVCGDGSSVMLLQSLGVRNADLFVASMGNDEANLIAAATAKGLGAKTVVARVDKAMYVESNILYETVLGIDYILSPDALAALEIASYIEHPGIIATDEFGRGLVRMLQIRVAKTPTVDGKTIKDVITPGSGALIGVIERGGKYMIPRGDAVIEPGDHIGIIGQKEKLQKLQKMFQDTEMKPRRVAIMGGSKVGFRVAKALDGNIKSVKLFERREDRSNELANQLIKAKVVCRDAASRAALEQEHIEGVDFFVAATSDDERNIMAGVLAKEVGAKSVVAIINQPDFAPLVKRLGIDLAVTPRASVANRIIKLAHQEKFTSLAILAEGQIEVMEFQADKHSPIIGKPLMDVSAKFPREALIATILRGDKVIVPSGSDCIQEHDSLIVIAAHAAVEPVRKVLQKR
jgi:trk system potassium uptake protein TrkA